MLEIGPVASVLEVPSGRNVPHGQHASMDVSSSSSAHRLRHTRITTSRLRTTFGGLGRDVESVDMRVRSAMMPRDGRGVWERS